MTTLKWFSFSFLLLFLMACSQVEENSQDSQAEEATLIENSGLYRGYEMGWEPDSILAKEVWTPKVANDSTIRYHEKVFLLGDTVLVDAYIAFDVYGLFEVQVDAFTDDDSLSKAIIENWSAKLSESFGEPKTLLYSKRWTTFSESNNTVEITLSQERNDQNQRFISLNYLEPLDDEY